MDENRIFDLEQDPAYLAYLDAIAAEVAILQAESKEHQRDYFKYLDWLENEDKLKNLLRIKGFGNKMPGF